MPVVVISSEVVFGAPEIARPDAVPAVTIIEFDAPRCVNVYGTAPCTAAVGVTGERKCFNTRATCQDLANFASELVTFRFTRPSARIHRDDGGDVIPSVRVVRTTPQLLNPGRDLGQREVVTVSFEDHPHTDTGIDPYLSERPYNAFTQGTFWGKFRARYSSLRGLPLRIYRGELGDELSEMDVWHYVIENATLSGTAFTIIGKDHLKLLDGDRAQAPAVSLGQLAAPLAAGGGSLTLEPTGIGNEDYPVSGRAAIGGKEIVDYTRAGDVVTLTARGVSNTDDQGHDEGDRFQVVLQYTAQPVEAIINDILTNYTEADPAWIPYSDWVAEVGPIVGQLYSAEIAEPTDVRKLINELIEQVGLIIWWDAQAMLIRLSALRPVLSTAAVVDENTMARGSFSATEQPAKRISEVWTYFNLRNPLERIDDTANFASIAVGVDASADPEEPPAIYKVFSRWIGFGNRAAAVRVNGLLRSRYSQPPRRFRYELRRGSPMPTLGRGSQIEHYSIQDETGDRDTRPVQVVSAAVDFDKTTFEVEEMIFTANDDLGDVRLVVIDVDVNNVNLRTVHDSFYATPTGGEEILCIVDAGVTIGSDDAALPSFDVGAWPAVTITLELRGAIKGAGGRGGSGGVVAGPGPSAGQQGGTALLTTVAIELDSSGTIAGGGGGGGGAQNFVGFVGPGGGGGAGVAGGPAGLGPVGISGGGVQPTAGSSDVGGTGGADSARTAGDGAAPGAAGDAALPDGAAGGAAGFAVDGDSLVTYTNPGTIIGPVTN